VEVGLARGECRRQRLRIHVRDHQHPAVGSILNDAGTRPLGPQATSPLSSPCRSRGRPLERRTGSPRPPSPLHLRYRVQPAMEYGGGQTASAAHRARRPRSRPAGAPPEAITGTRTRVAIAPGAPCRSRGGCVSVHRSDEQLAGAKLGARTAHSTASSSVGRRPPWVTTSQRGVVRGAVSAGKSTRVDRAHDRLAAEAIGAGGQERRRRDGRGVERNLVAPARSTSRISSTLRTPPPPSAGRTLGMPSAGRPPARCRAARGRP